MSVIGSFDREFSFLSFAFGFLLCGGAYYAWKNKKTNYFLNIKVSSGEFKAIVSTDIKVIENVRAAIFESVKESKSKSIAS